MVVSRKDTNFIIGLSLKGLVSIVPSTSTASESISFTTTYCPFESQNLAPTNYCIGGNYYGSLSKKGEEVKLCDTESDIAFFHNLEESISINFALSNTTAGEKLLDNTIPITYNNFANLQNDFSDELVNYSSYLTIPMEEIKEQFNYVALKLSALKFENYSVELMPLNSIKFTLKFSEGRTLRLSKSFVDLGNVDKDQIFYSFFVNKELIEAETNTLDEFIEEFKRFMSI